MRDRWLTVLVAVGVVALLAGTALGITALRSDDADEAPAAAPRKAALTKRVESAKGGFVLRAPTAMRVKREGRVVRLTSRDRALVVTVGPGEPGTLPAASKQLVGRIRSSYSSVQVIGRRNETVDKRTALTTYGRATSGKVKLRFAVLVVKARPRNYAITTFTAAGSDPKTVLPAVNQVVGSFHVLAKK
jgi:hypothetical protein